MHIVYPLQPNVTLGTGGQPAWELVIHGESSVHGDTLPRSPESLATSLKCAVRNAMVARDHMKTSMNRRTFVQTLPGLAVLAAPRTQPAQEVAPAATGPSPITLPKPQTEGGRSVLAALQERRTIRNIRPDSLPPEVLSNLLWAAFGVNRDRSAFGKPGRTAASASNSQEIDLYVALPEGAYLYEALPHRLAPVVAGDFRARAGRGAAATAPVNIFFVADLTRYDEGPGQPDRRIGDPEVQKGYY
mgnify:CR=1 FL=1